MKKGGTRQASTRGSDVLFGTNNLENLYTLKHFPVFISCTSEKSSNDVFEDMTWDISKDSGVIQLRGMLPLNVIYSGYHSEAIGKTWEDHHKKFARLVKKYAGKNILEIGGSNGRLAKDVLGDRKEIRWTMIEPNPSIKSSKEIKIIKKVFDKNIKLKWKYDTVVHSHVLEHFYEPGASIGKIYELLFSGGKHIFSVPNLYSWLKNGMPNALNFEHTIFLTEYFIDILLKQHGFKIIQKKHFGEHSIFYITEKTSGVQAGEMKFRDKYLSYKKIYTKFIDNNDKLIKNLNKSIEDFDGPVYLFGAHIFSQFLLNTGLKSSKIQCILDNSKLKQGKRLYGTRFVVQSPEILKEKRNALIVLRAGLYTKEINKQIYKINSKVKVIS